jgi:hypothetical protein
VGGVSVVVDIAVLAWILYRQRAVRRVPLRFGAQLPVLIAVFGIIQMVDYTDTHDVSATVLATVLGSVAVGAGAFGVLRGYTVRLFNGTKGRVLRQGTWLTMLLWLVSVAVHFASFTLVHALHGPTGVASSSLLLYLAVSVGVQNSVVRRRARRWVQEGGPIDAASEPIGATSWRSPDEPPTDGDGRGGRRGD